MKPATLFLIAGSTALVKGHATVYNIWINGTNQGLGNSASGYIRSPPNNDPIKNLTSNSLRCNVNNVATSRTLPVSGGDKITFEWHHDSNSASDDIIASSHKGPVITYIAPTSSNGAGDVWVKLAEEGYNSNTKTWAVDNLIANKGKHSITLPNLKAGTYLLRPEIIALHESDAIYPVNPVRGAQLYMECVQIQVISNGNVNLPAGVAIPGAYKYTDPGIFFNLYSSFSSYKIPGPPVWDGTSPGFGASSEAPTTSSKATTSSISPTTTTTKKPTTPCITTKSTTLTTQTSSAPPTSSGSVIPRYGQCGGLNYSGGTTCEVGAVCKVVNPYYSQCMPGPTPPGTVARYGQCGGSTYSGSKICEPGSVCKVVNDYYSQCLHI